MGLFDSLNPFNNVHAFNPADHIPDLSSRVIVVTGGNADVGKEGVLQLARHNPKRLYLGARSKLKFDAAAEDIRTKIPDVNLYFLQVDLASFESVKHAAETMIAENDRLDILMNNAGIMCAPHSLTKLCRPQDGGKWDIIQGTQNRLLFKAFFTTVRRIEACKYPACEEAVKGVSSNNKRIDSSWKSLYSLAEEYRIRGSLTAKLLKLGDRMVNVLPTELGALNQLWAATWPKEGFENGGYYTPVGCSDGGSTKAKDETLADFLWNWQEAEFQNLGYL